MSDFIIEESARIGAPPLIALWGPSTSGKTMTALLIARGIVGPEGQIGVIDTENGRARFHADKARGADDAPWLRLDFQPPFTPERYTAAIKALVDKGADVVIIDSGSHVWEGEGGVIDQAEAIPGHGLRKWKAPKTAYKRMVNHSLRAAIPIIWCLRSKKSFAQKKVDGKDVVVQDGLEPVSGYGLIYEMTISILLSLNAIPAALDPNATYKSNAGYPAIKMPDEMRQHVRQNQHLGIEFGEQVAIWVNSAGQFDKHEAELLQTARDITSLGTDRLRQHFKSLNNADKKILKPHMDNELKAAAALNDPEPESTEEESIFGGPS